MTETSAPSLTFVNVPKSVIGKGDYLSLCRTAALPRRFERGDWYYVWGWNTIHGPHLYDRRERELFGTADVYEAGPIVGTPEATRIWLPRLDELLDLIEAAGIRDIVLDKDFRERWWAYGAHKQRPEHSGSGATRECAALKLLMNLRVEL